MSGPPDDPSSRGPLRGVTVLDATTMMAGPYTTGLLADFGADVIKVEHPDGGDPMRRLSTNEHGHSMLSKIANRNKRSVGLDLNVDEGRAIFRRLAARVDVVVTNFRLSTLRRWRLDHATLAAEHPRLVMYHLSAYGPGPREDDPGFARVAEAYTGLTYATGDPEGPPMFSGYAIADGVAGVHGAFSVMLGLYEAMRSGRGQLVEASLAGSMIRMLEGFVAAYDGTGRPPSRTGNHNGIVPNDLYRTRDGRWLVLPVTSPNMWTRLCGALDLGHLADDPRFATNADRLGHRAELDAVLIPAIEARTFDDAYTQLRDAGVAVGPVNSMADLFADDAVWDNSTLVRVRDERLDRDVAMPGVVPRLSVTPGEVRRVGPEPGEQTAEVLRTVAGMTDDEIRRARESGAIAAPR